MFKHILVPTDGSRFSDRAIRDAAEIAGKVGAKLTGIHVVPPYSMAIAGWEIVPAVVLTRAEYRSATAKAAKAVFEKIEKTARAAGLACATLCITEENPWKAIVQVARSHRCDLIVMASHGRRGLSGLILGSETTKVLTHSRVPVLVVR